MLKLHSNFLSLFTILLMSAGIPFTAHAQSSDTTPVVNGDADVQPLRRKRVVQPIEYWVDANSLNQRDNPVAGSIVGTLEYGRKVLAYSQYENWVQISKIDDKPKWVNSDFLSNSRLSWASYSRSRPTRASDITHIRIKDSDNKKKRIFGVRLKVADTGNVIITTKEDTSQGSHFQNRFVSCEDETVVGVRLIGEGNNFLSAQNDYRNQAFNIYDAERIEDTAADSTEDAISKFACKSRAF